MGKPYSTDLRRRVLKAIDEGMPATAAGARFDIPASTAIRWAAIWRKERRDTALAMGGDRRSEPLEAWANDILAWVEERPGLTLDAIVARLAAQAVDCSDRAVARLLKRHGVTYKKRRWSRASETARTSPKREKPGRPRCRSATLRNWSSSTKAASTRA